MSKLLHIMTYYETCKTAQYLVETGVTKHCTCSTNCINSKLLQIRC